MKKTGEPMKHYDINSCILNERQISSADEARSIYRELLEKEQALKDELLRLRTERMKEIERELNVIDAEIYKLQRKYSSLMKERISYSGRP